ncbi:unnamed protein product [Pleuronectes platessa]|uniref:Uncharacterized protein n=1 Tax=Pleuronectes platessa TaxID=8262 RepID=A0A9N7V2I2_PLEPL|nr:unnamed protein product [Pleuronectes platessa]
MVGHDTLLRVPPLRRKVSVPRFGLIAKLSSEDNERKTDKAERENRFFSSVSRKKRFTYFMFSRSCCFVSSCLADCGSGLLIAVIDMEESGAGCQKPQKKKERTLKTHRRSKQTRPQAPPHGSSSSTCQVSPGQTGGPIRSQNPPNTQHRIRRIHHQLFLVAMTH